MFSFGTSKINNAATENTGKEPTTNNNINAQMLIEALENIIVPIIQSHSLAPDPQNSRTRVGSSLAPEAQQLITALNRFVTAIVRPSTAAAISNVVVRVAPVKKPRLLEVALDTMQRRVFNRMPIRLLTFNSDGSGIGLTERGQLWQKISAEIEKDFDEDQIKSDIRHIERKQAKASDLTSQAGSTESPEFLAIQYFLARYGQYAILSHTWLHDVHGEVTYNDWQNGNFVTDSPGYQKLIKFCRAAATQYHVTLGWMDTICIDKESSSELDESIRSMFLWYRHSHTCITYLADTTMLRDMHNDAWFTRGWTLQELLAPVNLKFHNNYWKALSPGTANDKANNAILDVIQDAAGITKEELGQKLWFVPISRRMQWAAARQVTREEDAAYSLMGIFGVSISIAYGEGSEKAFFRLAQAILNTNTLNLLDIMNWGYGHEFPKPSTIAHTSGVIPRSPKQYAWRTRTDVHWYRLTRPVTLTHLGLHVPVLLMPAVPTESRTPHASIIAFGSYYAIVSDVDLLYPNNTISSKNYAVLDSSIFESSKGKAGRAHNVIFFGVLNISETSTSVELPHRGISYGIPFKVTPSAVRGIASEETIFTRIPVRRAVVFDLDSVNNASLTVRKSELQKHGMSLRMLYL